MSRPHFVLWRNLREVFRVAPLPTIAILSYVAMRSTSIFPHPDDDGMQRWHRAFLGWYDIGLMVAVLWTFLVHKFRPLRDTAMFGLVMVAVLLFGFINTEFVLGPSPIIAGSIYFFRFLLTFTFAVWLVRQVGVVKAESLIVTVYLILAASSVFVFEQIYPEFKRIFCSGMTVASSSQLATSVAFIALIRRNLALLTFSLAFLLLTFSRTSITLFLVLLIVYLLFSGEARFGSKAKYFVVIAGIIGIGAYLIATADYFEGTLQKLSDPEELATLDLRLFVWKYAIELIRSHAVPLSGVGFNTSPSLLQGFEVETYGRPIFAPASFHSMIFEFGIGLGIFSIVLFGCMLMRIWQTFRGRCFPAFFAFAFFLTAQSIDFTFYRPKEVIIWSVILGLAEGQWRVQREERDRGRPRHQLALHRGGRDDALQAPFA